jgi:hypothetical protein
VTCDSCVLWLCAIILIAIGTQATVTNAQQASPVDQNSTRSQLECRYPADPHRRQHGCNDKDFGLDETLAGEWNHFRQAAKRIGITPTASYVGALQTNPSGGSDQVWSYAGQLSIGIEADFNQLIKARVECPAFYVPEAMIETGTKRSWAWREARSTVRSRS